MKISAKKAEIERKMAQLESELKNIEKSAAFRKESAFMKALNNLMKKHGYSKSDLITLLQSDSPTPTKRGRKKSAAKKRKARKLKIFKNPKTGEIVKTRGGNHKVLKSWKAKYKLSNIDDWLVETKD